MSKKKANFFSKKDADIIPIGNIISYWKFDGNANDSVGGNNGVLSDTINQNGLYSGNPDEAIKVQSLSTSYVQVTNDSSLSFGNGVSDVPFSITTIVRFDTNVSLILNMILNKRGNPFSGQAGVDREYQLSRFNSNNRLRVILWDNITSGKLELEGSTALINGNVYHLTLTYDGSSLSSGIKLYVDGVLETLTDFSAGVYNAMNNYAADLIFGRLGWNYGASPNNGLDGVLDGTLFWDKELNQQEITSIYNKQSSGQPIL